MTFSESIEDTRFTEDRAREEHIESFDNVRANLLIVAKPCIDCGTLVPDCPIDLPAICDRCLEWRR